jgi:hypothetical protein
VIIVHPIPVVDFICSTVPPSEMPDIAIQLEAPFSEKVPVRIASLLVMYIHQLSCDLPQRDSRESACNTIRRALYGALVRVPGKGLPWDRLEGSLGSDLKYEPPMIMCHAHSLIYHLEARS